MTKTMQKSHQNPTSDDFQIKLLANYLISINLTNIQPKSQLWGWMKWN